MLREIIFLTCLNTVQNFRGRKKWLKYYVGREDRNERLLYIDTELVCLKERRSGYCSKVKRFFIQDL